MGNRPQDGAHGGSRQHHTPVPCPRCETGVLVHRHCRSICENCGYVESCEDNFVPNQANPKAITNGSA